MSHRSLLFVAAMSLFSVACSRSPQEIRPPDDLSLAGQQGWQIAASKGCMSCHGRDGVGGTGPAWIDLAGSTRALADGTQVVADRDYLVRSLTDPQADVVNGFNIVMPTVPLTEAEIDSIIDYIEEIS